ncbi:hypothetical protein RIF29_20557 [Crotalaria pallida]|uniref:Uncharacterized protein n=1 Tax=Crotalaria pallida TaxID=3830 RepID=A0AAN9I6F5_CROPI
MPLEVRKKENCIAISSIRHSKLHTPAKQTVRDVHRGPVPTTLKATKSFLSCMWRKYGRSGGGGKKPPPPPDVPRGHLAVMVGEAKRRFVIRADYLNHPVLQQLLEQANNEGHGFNKSGPLAIPCDEFLFEDIIQSLRSGTNSRQPSCHVPLKKVDLSSMSKDTVPLLQGFDSKRKSSC